MAIIWGLLLVIACGFGTGVLSLPTVLSVTKGENAVIPFSHDLGPDKPPEAYVRSLQSAKKARPFYIHFDVRDADGTYFTDMLVSRDQRGRMSVSFEMRENVLSVYCSIRGVLTSDSATYLLTIVEKGSENASFVRETFLQVLSSAPRNHGRTIRRQSNFSTLAYTAPQVTTWRYVRFSAAGAHGAIFLCNLLQSSGLITGHVFHGNYSFNKLAMVDVDSSYRCCMNFSHRLSCEYYEFDGPCKKVYGSCNLVLLSATEQEFSYTPLRKPSSTPMATDRHLSSQTTTHVPPETNEENLLNLYLMVTTPLSFFVVLFVIVCICLYQNRQMKLYITRTAQMNHGESKHDGVVNAS